MTVSGRGAPWTLEAGLLSRAGEGRNAPPDADAMSVYSHGVRNGSGMYPFALKTIR